MSGFYDGTKLLSMVDINGNKPEIYMVTTNRNGGKTTYYSRLCVNRFKDSVKRGDIPRSKFCLIYRFNYELDDCAEKFFKDISNLFFKGDVMTSKRKASGIYHELFLNDESCGYAISLNAADQLKKFGHLLSDVDRMLFDEFQSETNHYCNDEVKKFISVHTTIARGQGKQIRYVPVYMCGNPVTLLTPYYIAMGIADRLQDDTKFLRGDGFILEQGFNISASKSQKESGFNRAFIRDSYVAYSSESVYLNDNKSFVDKPKGKCRYLATLRYNGFDYAIKEYAELGIVYCDDKADSSFKGKITVTTDDHQINYVMLKRNDFFISSMRYYFERGCFRFKDLRCKEVVLKALSY